MDEINKMIEVPVSETSADEWSRLPAEERAAMGVAFDRVLTERRKKSVDDLFALFERVSREARERGLTDEMIDAELAAWNAEDRD